MPKKGTINNPLGRPKGKPNRITADLKQRIKLFLDNNFQVIEKDFKKMDPAQRAAFFEKLLSYAIPKMQSSDVKIDFENLSEPELDAIIERLITKPDPQ